MATMANMEITIRLAEEDRALMEATLHTLRATHPAPPTPSLPLAPLTPLPFVSLSEYQAVVRYPIRDKKEWDRGLKATSADGPLTVHHNSAWSDDPERVVWLETPNDANGVAMSVEEARELGKKLLQVASEEEHGWKE